MKRILFHIFVFLASCGIGYFGVALISPNVQPLKESGEVAAYPIDQQTSEVTSASDDSSEYKEALEDIWIENDETRLNGYSIKRKCDADENGFVYIDGKILWQSHSET